MKMIALAAAGLVAAMSLTPTPAEAQHRGGGYYGNTDRGWHDGRHDRRWDRNRHWRGDRGWRGSRSRVVCRWDRGYYGRVKRCFRAYR